MHQACVYTYMKGECNSHTKSYRAGVVLQKDVTISEKGTHETICRHVAINPAVWSSKSAVCVKRLTRDTDYFTSLHVSHPPHHVLGLNSQHHQHLMGMCNSTYYKLQSASANQTTYRLHSFGHTPTINPFNASCFKLLLFEGFCAILV